MIECEWPPDSLPGLATQCSPAEAPESPPYPPPYAWQLVTDINQACPKKQDSGLLSLPDLNVATPNAFEAPDSLQKWQGHGKSLANALMQSSKQGQHLFGGMQRSGQRQTILRRGGSNRANGLCVRVVKCKHLPAGPSWPSRYLQNFSKRCNAKGADLHRAPALQQRSSTVVPYRALQPGYPCLSQLPDRSGSEGDRVAGQDT